MRHVTEHGAVRLAQRAGVNAAKLEAMIGNRRLPDGEYEVPGVGTAIVQDGMLRTFLDEGTAVVRRRQQGVT
jgi:hypothetical protein